MYYTTNTNKPSNITHGIYKNKRNYDFTGATLNYVTYAMS